MNEVEMLQLQLVCILKLSNDVDAAKDVFMRKLALEELHKAVQSARPTITIYAAELAVPKQGNNR